MFIGEYNYSIDDKNRLGIPVKFRSELLKGAVVTKGIDDCLSLYTKEEWRKYVTKISAMPTSKFKNRAFQRLMLAGAMDEKIDKQGRITLPDYLKKYGKIKKKVVIAGLYNRLEIWDEKKWDEYRKKSEASSSEIAETLDDIGS